MTVFIYLSSIQNLNKTCKIYYNYSVLVVLCTGNELYIMCGHTHHKQKFAKTKTS